MTELLAEVVEKYTELMALMKSNQDLKIDETRSKTESIS